MAKKKQDVSIDENINEQVKNEEVIEEKAVDEEISLLDFIEKYNIAGFLRRAYLRKFSADQKFSENDWLKK